MVGVGLGPGAIGRGKRDIGMGLSGLDAGIIYFLWKTGLATIFHFKKRGDLDHHGIIIIECMTCM